jgi:hypothetical protein
VISTTEGWNRRWTPMDADERGICSVRAHGITAECLQEPKHNHFARTIGVHRRPSAVNLLFALSSRSSAVDPPAGTK